MLWQPEGYPHCLPYRYCGAPGLAEIDLREPGEIPAGDAPGGERPIIVVTRSTNPEGFRSDPTLWNPIRQGRRIAEMLQIDPSTRVYVYESR